MANLHLVTGYAGKEHITSNDQGSFNAALMGTGEFILERGKQFSAQVISNNNVRIFDGDMLMQGRHIRLKEDTYVDLFFENGMQGYKRSDLIVVRYEKDPATEIESASLVVIKGVPTEDAYVSPEKITGNIITENALQNDTVLYKVNFDGLAIQEPEKMFSTVPTLETMKKDTIEQLQKEAEKVIQDMTYAVDELTPLFGAEDPTPETHGRLKQFYANTETGQLFICIDAGETYTWVKIGGGGFGSHLGNVQDLILEENADSLTLTWKDPDDVVFNGETIAKWAGTKVIRKEGSSPESVEDGVLIADSTVRGQYAFNGLDDVDVEKDIQYNYALFPYTAKEVYTTSDDNRVMGTVRQEWNLVSSNNIEQDASKPLRWRKTNSTRNASAKWFITFSGKVRQRIYWYFYGGANSSTADTFTIKLRSIEGEVVTETELVNVTATDKDYNNQNPKGILTLDFEPNIRYELVITYNRKLSNDGGSCEIIFGEIKKKYFINGVSSFLEENTWEQIVGAIEAGIAKDLWIPGDTKDDYLIIGFDHDYLSDGSGKAKVTFLTGESEVYKSALDTRQNVLNINYSELNQISGIRDYVKSKIPQELLSRLKTVKKEYETTAGDVLYNDNELFLLSSVENNYGSASEGSLQKEYEIYDLYYNYYRIFYPTFWWTRDVRENVVSTIKSTMYMEVNAKSGCASDASYVYSIGAVRMGFCV